MRRKLVIPFHHRRQRPPIIAMTAGAMESDKQECLGMEKTGGPASYVELQSCLEIRRDARDIRNGGPLESDVGTAGTSKAIYFGFPFPDVVDVAGNSKAATFTLLMAY